MTTPSIMPFDVPAYIADTTHLSNAQHGAYLLILMTLWQHGGTVVDDDATLARIAKLTMDKWRKIAPPVRALLRSVESGRLTQKRLADELSKVTLRSEKNRANGSLGGAAKSLKNHDPPLANAIETLKRNDGAGPAPTNLANLSFFGEEDSESEKEVKKESKKESTLGTARARGPHTLPDDWRPSPADLAYAQEKGFSQFEAMDMAEAFRNHHHHKGTKGLKWSAGWQLWVRNEIKFSSGRRGDGNRGHQKVLPADLASGRFRRTPT